MLIREINNLFYNYNSVHITYLDTYVMRSAVAKEEPPNFITILTTPSSGSLISISSLK